MPPPLPKQDEKAIDEELSFSHISYEMVMDMIKNIRLALLGDRI